MTGKRLTTAAIGGGGLLAGALLMGTLAGATAQETKAGFDFGAPPSNQANRVFSVNRVTGEMSACQFERPDSALVGVTRCFARGEGAGAQKPGNYRLVATNFSGETGIFRANADTGEMSICYVRDVPKAGGGTEPAILCTPAAK